MLKRMFISNKMDRPDATLSSARHRIIKIQIIQLNLFPHHSSLVACILIESNRWNEVKNKAQLNKYKFVFVYYICGKLFAWKAFRVKSQ